MKKAAAALAGMALLITGCTSMAGHMPDDTSADDRRTLAAHAKAYWGDKEVEVTDLPIPSHPTEVSEEENTQIDSYMEGFSEAIKRIKRACTTEQSFSIDNLRYGCMPLRERGDPNGFSTGQ